MQIYPWKKSKMHGFKIWQVEETTQEKSKIISFSMIAYFEFPLLFVNLILNFNCYLQIILYISDLE